MAKELDAQRKKATLINYIKSRLGWELWRISTNHSAVINNLTILAPTEAVALKIAENYYRKLYS